MDTGRARINKRAQAALQERFTALAHHLTAAFLVETFRQMNQHGAAGADRMSLNAYRHNLDVHLADLGARLTRRTYHAPPVRRVYIPKPGQPAKQRPLAIPGVEDRLLPGAERPL